MNMTRIEDLAPHYGNTLVDATIPELPGHYRGKVRDNYDLGDGRRLIIASDRLSAFDRMLTAIPLKGQVLTQTARFWFDATRHICPNHVIGYPDPNVLLCRRVDIIKLEVVVRDYLAGSTSSSILPMYQSGRRQMYGLDFPDGLRANQRLPQTIVTPATKAFDGEHDEETSAGEIVAGGLLSAAHWDEVSALAQSLFAQGRAIAAQRGLILADTKYEFGFDEQGRIILADEIHTPDSSRYWRAATYEHRVARGEPPDSLDKDFVRRWVTARCNPYGDPVPDIPREVVLEAASVYIDAFQTITGQGFDLPDPAVRPLDRIRGNLSGFF